MSLPMSNATNPSDTPLFDTAEETWFCEPRRATRPSQRPTEPPPSEASHIDDSIADGWFIDV
jgi:hypothetical protein